MQERQVKAGTVIFREGEPSDEALVIIDGTVEVLRDYGDRPVLLGALHAGQIVGEMGVLAGKPRSATVRAVSDVTLAFIPAEEFLDAFGGDNPMGIRILRMLCERLRDADNRIAESEMQKSRVTAAEAASIRLLPATGMLEAQFDPAGIAIENLPYSVGRQPLVNEPTIITGKTACLQTGADSPLGSPHFVIEDLFGDLIVHDLETEAGTIVNGRPIGRDESSRVAMLRAGENEIRIGPPDSPFRFTLVVETR